MKTLTINTETSSKKLSSYIEDRRPDFTLKNSDDKNIYFYKTKGGFVEELEGNNPVFTSLTKEELREYYNAED